MGKRGPKPKIPVLKINQTEGICRCCEKPAATRGLCRSCYRRACSQGIVDKVALPSRGPGPKPKTPVLKINQTEGICRCCENPTEKRGLCKSCYGAARNQGIIDEVALPSIGDITAKGKGSPFWKEDAGYDAIHKRNTRTNGPAREHPCSTCNRRAAHWAYQGNCPGEVLTEAGNKPHCRHMSHYFPLCIPCHVRWDGDMDYVAERAA